MYHRIDARHGGDDARLCVTPAEFAAQLEWLAAHGYRPCTAAAFADWYEGRAALPEGSVLITFDDGYAGLHRHAMPALHARGWPATVFLLSALVGDTDRWAHDAAAPHRPQRLLSREQIGEMARHGIEFHSHSRSHRELTALDDAALRQEVHDSRAELQQLLGHEVPFFAYPYGRFDARVQAAVADAGYRLAFSVRSGFNRPQEQQRWAVRRLDIQGGDSPRRFGRKLAFGTNDGSLAGRMRYVAQRLAARAGVPRP